MIDSGAAVKALFAAAIEKHRQGRLDDAEPLYRALLERQPDHGGAIEMLGVAACQRGKPVEGARLLAAATAATPDAAQILVNLGFALQALGRPAEAARAVRRGVRLDPAHLEAGTALGETLLSRGQWAEAAELFQALVAAAPGTARLHFNFACALARAGRPDAALKSYLDALGLQPVYPDAYSNLGSLMTELGFLDQALSALSTAIAQKPDHGQAHSNLGRVLRDLGRLDEAEAAYRTAVQLLPASAMAHFNLGSILQDKGLASAETAYRAAIERDPEQIEAHWNLALLLLKQGRYAEGWAEHEWRFRSRKPWAPKADFAQPMWRGEPLAGKTILLHSEQGLGDVLQFVRYAAPLAVKGARVVLWTYPPLRRLLRTVPGLDEIVIAETEVPAFDYHLPILSLPFAFGTELSTIPADLPYIHADPSAAGVWRDRLSDLGGVKVGLVWAGGARPDDPDATRVDRRRSLALAQFADLADMPGVRLISLQKGPPARQTETFQHGAGIIDFMAEIDDFADTAALIDALDLVISVDTSVAHLAGALGKPVWILSRFNGCWRWLESGDESPWYPGVARLFREQRPDSWPEVVARVGDALRKRIN